MTRVRPATVEDVPKLVELVEGYWHFEGIPGFDPRRIEIQLRRILSEPELGNCWLASVDDRAAGYLVAVYVFSLEHLGLTAEIDELFVTSDFRARGIGAALLRTAEATFMRKGYTNVSLQLSRGNHAAKAFYHGQGYTDRSGFELVEKTLRRD